MSRSDITKSGAMPVRVGLDIGSHSVKGVELVGYGPDATIRSAGLSVVSRTAGKQPVSDRHAIVQAVRKLWSSAGFKTRKVVLALPPALVHMQWEQIEPPNDDELDALARSTAVKGSPFLAHDAVVDYRILSYRAVGLRKIYDVMLVAASSAAVDDLLDIAEKAGLEPLAVDIGSAASLRSIRALQQADSPLWGNQPKAHCIIGAIGTMITVFRGESIEFARTVSIGGDDFTECIAEKAGVDWSTAEKLKMNPATTITDDGTVVISDENQHILVPCEDILSRLSREILRSLSFFSSHYAEGSYLGMIGDITMSGGGSLLKGIDKALQNCGVNIQPAIDPFSGFSVEARKASNLSLAGLSPAFSTAMGLAVSDYWTQQDFYKAESAA